MPRQREDVTGKSFNFLVARRVVGRTKNGTPLWEFACACGSIIVRQLGAIKAGAAKSCGCKRSALQRSNKTTHGMSGTKEYHAWVLMLSRCHNESDSSYHRYGGRGVTVCGRWRESFESFLADMGPSPSPAHTVDRKDGTKGYDANNCRWATRREQSNNRPCNIHVTMNGRTMTLSQWCDELALPYKTVHARIKAGWEAATALTTPVRPIRRRSACCPGCPGPKNLASRPSRSS